MSIQTYRQNLASTGSPQQIEFQAFAHVIHGLRAAEAETATAHARIRALQDNHKLWTVLVVDLLSDGNGLPTELRAQLISIGQWACRYSLQAMSAALSLSPLIAVNTNIAQGLSEQAQAMPQRAAMAAAG